MKIFLNTFHNLSIFMKSLDLPNLNFYFSNYRALKYLDAKKLFYSNGLLK